MNLFPMLNIDDAYSSEVLLIRDIADLFALSLSPGSSLFLDFNMD